MTTAELTRGEEEVIKISDAHTFSTGLHSEISIPKGKATSTLKPLGSSLCWGVMVNLPVGAQLVGICLFPVSL